MEIIQEVWGFTSGEEGEAVILYTMTSESGARVQVTNLGAALVSLLVPDREGNMADVVLGYKDWRGYMNDRFAMGKTVGSCFSGSASGGALGISGGRDGALLADKVWESRVEGNRVVFSTVCPDNTTVEVAYYWSESDGSNDLEIVYTAAGDGAAAGDISNRIFFNLYGHDGGTVLRHFMELRASKFAEIGPDKKPTGAMLPVNGRPMDFRVGRRIGTPPGPECPVPAGTTLEYGRYWCVSTLDPQIARAGGLDHIFAVDGWRKNILAEIGALWCVVSGRKMTILTSQPGLRLCAGEGLQLAPEGKNGFYETRGGVVLAPTGLPGVADSSGDGRACGDGADGAFAASELAAGEPYIQKTVYSFGTIPKPENL